jgi:hypothetical protein
LYFKKNQLHPANQSAAERLLNQRKRHVVKLSLTVTLVFAVFLFPHAITLLLKYFNKNAYQIYYQIGAIFFPQKPEAIHFFMLFKAQIFGRHLKRY